MFEAHNPYRLWAVGVMLEVEIVGRTLLPITFIAIITAVGIVQAGLDLYQGKPAPSRIEGSV